MTRKIAIMASFLIISPLCALAQDEETIDHVTDDNVIVLQNGQAYQSDDVTSLTWAANDDVLILNDDKIVDKDQNEAVDVTQTDVPDEDTQGDNDPELRL
jgi:hypothetical protein